MVLFLRSLCLTAILLAIFSCRKPARTDWDVDAVVPVLTSNLNISNFAGDSLFDADNTGLLHLNIRREVGNIMLDSLLEIEDTKAVNSFTSESQVPITLGPGTQFPNLKPQNLKFKLDSGILLRRAVIRSAKFIVKFSNDLTEPLDLVYKMDGATKNGVPFIIKETVPPGKYSLTREYSLAGYELNLRGSTGTTYNTLAQTFTVAVSAQANNVVVAMGQGAHTEISFTELIPDYVEGYFGQRTVKIPADTAKLSLVENFSAKNLLLADATMDFRILNEFGAEFRANINGVSGINYGVNKTVVLQTNQLANLNINRATRVNGAPVASVKEISFRKDNSNIVDFISNLPDAITYSGSVYVNPLKNISGYNDFAYYNTGIRIMASLDIPLKFSADEFILKSTNNVSFSGASALDGVNYGQLVVKVTNGFPFSAVLQAYLYDENKVLLDSLFLPGANVIQNGQLNSMNEVTSALQSELRIPVNQAKLDNLKRAKTIGIRSRFLLPPAPPDIKLLEHYSMAVGIVAEINYKVKPR